MRAIPLLVALAGCAGEKDEGQTDDTGTPDADTDTDTDTHTDTHADTHTDTDTDTDTDADTDTDTGSLPGCTATVSGVVALAPSVTCATPADCQGTLYVGIYAVDPVTNPGAIPLAGNLAPAVDLGAGPTPYFVNGVPCGIGYISGFLDVNLSASGNPRPDSGDITGMSTQGKVPAAGASVPLVFPIRLP
jgi:hypothetical protein